MKILEALRGGSGISGQMRNAFDALQRLLVNRSDVDSVSRALVTLSGAVLWSDNELSDIEIEAFRKLLPEELSGRQADALVEELKVRQDWNIKEAAAGLHDIPLDEKISIIHSLAKLTCLSSKCSDAQSRILSEIGNELGVPDDDVIRIKKEVLGTFEHQQRIMRSWTGIIVVLVIIALFVLTATFLKAVLFGFILAYMFMPLSLYFYRQFSKPGPVMKILSSWKIPLKPLINYSSRIKRKIYFSAPVSAEVEADAQIKKNVNKAIGATAAVGISVCLLIALLVTSFSAYYVVGVSGDIKKWADRQVMEEKDRSQTETGVTTTESSYTKSFLSASIRKLENWRKRIEEWPVMQSAMEKIADSLRDQENQKALATAVLKRTGGFFSVTAGFFSTLVSAMFVMLMTVFFFLLFLQKMTLYGVKVGHRDGLGKYVVKSIFSSKWMPYTSPDTREQAQRILDHINTMLRTWLKGYLTIIAIESTIYVTLFTLLGVPYSLVLGIIAGSTVLLPYIGPIVSIALTLIVTMAVGTHPSVIMLGAILLVYIVVCGIFDQFILYPALVGEALGLTTIETIIVVLLGGLFAGLPGMIFAVPTASVIKYLIPQIYMCWQSPAELKNG